MNKTAVRAPLAPWLKVKLPYGANYERIKDVSERRNLHTVCEEARCPNIAECWGGGTATFMVLGQLCTRGCRFCSVPSALRPPAPDPDEPEHLAATLADMQLDYTVITTVCRDDLPDQGAAHIAACIRVAKQRNPNLKIEVLIQDFRGDAEALRTVLAVAPNVVAHNIETVERLTADVRDAKASYHQSLKVLADCRRMRPDLLTKSSLMLGLGEKQDEIFKTLSDLRTVGVSLITLGQYLRPGAVGRHVPVAEFITPERFAQYGAYARDMGFLHVASGPFVRSSYRAGELFIKDLLDN